MSNDKIRGTGDRDATLEASRPGAPPALGRGVQPARAVRSSQRWRSGHQAVCRGRSLRRLRPHPTPTDGPAWNPAGGAAHSLPLPRDVVPMQRGVHPGGEVMRRGGALPTRGRSGVRFSAFGLRP